MCFTFTDAKVIQNLCIACFGPHFFIDKRSSDFFLTTAIPKADCLKTTIRIKGVKKSVKMFKVYMENIDLD